MQNVCYNGPMDDDVAAIDLAFRLSKRKKAHIIVFMEVRQKKNQTPTDASTKCLYKLVTDDQTMKNKAVPLSHTLSAESYL